MINLLIIENWKKYYWQELIVEAMHAMYYIGDKFWAIFYNIYLENCTGAFEIAKLDFHFLRPIQPPEKKPNQ